MFNSYVSNSAFCAAARGRGLASFVMAGLLAAHVALAAEADVLDASMQAVPKTAEMPVPPPLPGGRESDPDRADRAGPEFASPGSERGAGGGADAGAGAGAVSVPAVVRLPGR